MVNHRLKIESGAGWFLLEFKLTSADLALHYIVFVLWLSHINPFENRSANPIFL